jgi:hypothetical protein
MKNQFSRWRTLRQCLTVYICKLEVKWLSALNIYFGSFQTFIRCGEIIDKYNGISVAFKYLQSMNKQACKQRLQASFTYQKLKFYYNTETNVLPWIKLHLPVEYISVTM